MILQARSSTGAEDRQRFDRQLPASPNVPRSVSSPRVGVRGALARGRRRMGCRACSKAALPRQGEPPDGDWTTTRRAIEGVAMWFWIILLLLGFAVVGAMTYRRQKAEAPDVPGKRHDPPHADDSSK